MSEALRTRSCAPPSALCLVALAGVLARRTEARAQAPSAAPAAAPQRDPRERVYVVASGDTISRIASRLGVTVAALAQRNYLTPPYRLALGRRLRLPAGVAPAILRTLPTRGALDSGAAAEQAATEPAAPSHRAGFVTLVRARDGVELATNFNAANPNFRRRLERFLRFRDGSQHVYHPRIPRYLVALSDHFDGRRITLVSAFRPMMGRGGDGPRTRHSQGYALDLRVEGVNLRQVYAFCQTLPNAGCGLNLGENYVHVDVRAESLAWVYPGGGRRAAAVQGEPPPNDANETPQEVRADSAPTGGPRGGTE